MRSCAIGYILLAWSLRWRRSPVNRGQGPSKPAQQAPCRSAKPYPLDRLNLHDQGGTAWRASKNVVQELRRSVLVGTTLPMLLPSACPGCAHQGTLHPRAMTSSSAEARSVHPLIELLQLRGHTRAEGTQASEQELGPSCSLALLQGIKRYPCLPYFQINNKP